MLRVVDLAVARGGVPLLEGVRLALGPGEALALRGPNGIGKTTLLRAIAGLQRPLSGRVEMAEDAPALAGHADGVKGALTAAQNLGFWARVWGGGAVEPALAAFGIGDLADRPARDLSAGQRRRLGLARLLVTGRPLWLLDEPTVSLDAPSVALFERALAGHRARGGAALVATHGALPGVPSLDLAPHRVRLPALGEGGDDDGSSDLGRRGGRRAPDRPDVDRPDADRPDPEWPDAEWPDAEWPDADRPDAEWPDADWPGAERGEG